jgi:drug/metabolite transporter (DMT)-like permease
VNRPLAFGYGFLVVSVFLWAGNSVVARFAMVSDVPPIGFAWWRWTIALAIFLPFTARGIWRDRALIRRNWRFIAAFGVVSIACYNTFFYLGLEHTTAIQGSLIQSVLPVLVLLLGLILFGEPITLRQWSGVVLSLAGAVLIVARGSVETLRALTLNVGDLWCLAAVLVWAGQIVLMRWKPRDLHITRFMTVAAAVGVAALTPAYVWEHASGRIMPVDWTTVALVLYVAFFASVIASTMYNEGVFRVGAATSGYFGNLFPVFSTGLAILFLGEEIAWYHWIGAALVLGGIHLATVDRRTRVGAGAADPVKP